MSKIAIIGNGHVGTAMRTLFPGAAVYDKHQPDHADRSAVEGADFAIVCVPTPSLSDGAADVSAVEEVVEWCNAGLICIKSTVPPGTTDRLATYISKRIVFSPEYEGETPWQRSVRDWPFVIVGGERQAANEALAHFAAVLGPEKSYWATDAVTAETVKYTENAWLAMQVTWANEMAGICEAVGTSWQQVRELWALDPRVSPWNTLVLPPGGYGGKCLPKDAAALIAAARGAGYEATFLEAMVAANERFRRCN